MNVDNVIYPLLLYNTTFIKDYHGQPEKGDKTKTNKRESWNIVSIEYVLRYKAFVFLYVDLRFT